MIVKRASRSPSARSWRTRARGSVIVEKSSREGGDRGFDAESLEFVDMIQAASSTRQVERVALEKRRRWPRCC